MTKPMAQTVRFQPQRPFSPYLPQFTYTYSYSPPEKRVKVAVTHYLLRALVIIEKIIRLLKSTTPFFEQYNHILKQLPNMYKMIKLIQEVQEATETEQNQLRERKEKRSTSGESKPKLFI